MNAKKDASSNEPGSATWRVFRITLITLAVTFGSIPVVGFVLTHVLPLLPPERHVGHGNSVASLRKSISGLSGLVVIECGYTATSTRIRGILPAPSDTRHETYGWISLDDESTQIFRARGTWVPIDISKIPSPLRETLPIGVAFLTSEEASKTFAYPYQTRACRVVMPVSGNTLYFITLDDEHSFSD